MALDVSVAVSGELFAGGVKRVHQPPLVVEGVLLPTLLLANSSANSFTLRTYQLWKPFMDGVQHEGSSFVTT